MTQPPITQVIASTELEWVTPEGAVVAVRVRIGVPFPEATGEWTCPIELDGIGPASMGIHGTDSLQALCLALRLVRTRLHHLIEQGGHLRDRAGAGARADTDADADADADAETRAGTDADADAHAGIDAALVDTIFGVSLLPTNP